MDLESDLMESAVPGVECFRDCKKHEHKVCYFKFRLEYYQVLGG